MATLTLEGVINAVQNFLNNNLYRLGNSVLIILAGFLLHKILTFLFERLKERTWMENYVTYVVEKLLSWGIATVVFILVLGEFGLTFAHVSGLMAAVGGTIFGFAAINTLGNAIAGIIVMVREPFKIGDRI